jgi:hypothetical protein
MLTAVLIAVLVTLVVVIGTSVLIFLKLQRSHWRTLDAMQRWVVGSLTSIETRLRYQSGLDVPGELDIVVIVTRDRSALLELCLRSIHQHEPGAHVVVVDVGSTDDTASVLQRLVHERVVSTTINHAPMSVAQWQKGYGIHEAWRVASMLHPRSITVIDDDMVVREPFLAACATACEHADVRVVALHRDSTQEKNHPVVNTVEHNGMRIELGATFNGAAFYMPWTTLHAWGPPPFNEGKRESGVEDWYYSRALASSNGRVAFLPRVVEQQGVVSLRDAVGRTRM